MVVIALLPGWQLAGEVVVQLHVQTNEGKVVSTFPVKLTHQGHSRDIVAWLLLCVVLAEHQVDLQRLHNNKVSLSCAFW
jgi:hypothetical protein